MSLEKLSGAKRRSEELRGTQRSSEKLKVAQRSSQELIGAQRSSRQLRGAQRSSRQLRGAHGSTVEFRGAPGSPTEPKRTTQKHRIPQLTYRNPQKSTENQNYLKGTQRKPLNYQRKEFPNHQSNIVLQFLKVVSSMDLEVGKQVEHLSSKSNQSPASE